LQNTTISMVGTKQALVLITFETNHFE